MSGTNPESKNGAQVSIRLRNKTLKEVEQYSSEQDEHRAASLRRLIKIGLETERNRRRG